MTILKEYDRIRLKTGQLGRIVEVFGDETYLAEIVNEKGEIGIEDVTKEDIGAVIVEVEQPFVMA